MRSYFFTLKNKNKLIIILVEDKKIIKFDNT